MACTQKVQKKRLNIYIFVVGCMNTNSDKKLLVMSDSNFNFTSANSNNHMST